MHPVVLGVPTHPLFVTLGVVVAALVFLVEARRRGRSADERLVLIVLGALVGGAVMMRLGTWAQHVDLRDNASLVEQWAYGNRSILGGLVGAWLGVHVAKRLTRYPLRTGDLFAPAVAAGLAVGRIGCLLSEPSRSGQTNWSFAWEIAFHAAAFAVLWGVLRHRPLPPGTTFVWYVAAYGAFRFAIEFWRGNDVAWHLGSLALTRPQLFLACTVPLLLARITYAARRGDYRAAPEPARVSA